jgi:hypothetical protein
VTNLNPVGYWPMHESVPPAAGDIETNYGSLGVLGTGFYPDWASANGNIITRQVPGALVGDSDTAAEFLAPGANTGGTTNSLYVPHNSPLSTLNPPFSVECWFYANNNNQGDIWGQEGFEGLNAGASGGGAGSVCGIRLFWNAPGLIVYNYYNSSTLHNMGSTSAAVNQWHHVVVTYDANTNISLYVDGTLRYNKPAVGLYAPDSWTPFQIGESRGNTRSFNGSIDEVAIYTNAITDASTHYSDGLGGVPGAYVADVLADNPVIYYRMNGPTYSPQPIATWPALLNYGSVAANGVYSPGTGPGVVAGPFAPGGAPLSGLSAPGATNVAQFSGVSSFADAGRATAYNPTGAVPFSVAAMFRGNPADNRLQTIVGHSSSSWAINLNTTGNLQCQLGTNGASAVTSTKVYNDGGWHQLVEVYTPAANPTDPGTNALYVDGLLDGISTAVSSNGILPGANVDVLIGSDPQFTNNPAGVGRQFSGQVCEVAIFTNALGSNQVRTLYVASGEFVGATIVSQPAATYTNGSVIFSVTVAGTAPLSYQWYFNTTPDYVGATAQSDTGGVTGSTTASLTNPNLLNYYFIVVTNNYGAVTSDVVSASTFIPTITSQFPITYTNQYLLYAGFNQAFSISASGGQPLSYQWYTNGVAAVGAINSSLTLSNVQVSFANNYCVVSNFFGSATSTVWSASITNPSAPYPQAVLALNPIAYWRMTEPDDGLGDGNANVVSFDYVGGNNGLYRAVTLGLPGYNAVTDPTATSMKGGSGASGVYQIGSNVDFATPAGQNAQFSVETWISFTANNANGIIDKGWGGGGEEFTLDTGANGNALRFFVRSAAGTEYDANSTIIPAIGPWYHLVGVCDQASGKAFLYVNGVRAGSANIPVHSGIVNINESAWPMMIGTKPKNTGSQYMGCAGYISDVALFNYALSASQISAEYYSAGIPPTITQQPPASTNVNGNASLIVAAAATGGPPLYYQWLDQNNNPVPFQTNATLNLPSVTANNMYTLQVSNAYGTALSIGMVVNVFNSLPVITQDISPTATTLALGSTAKLTVQVMGNLPLRYLWRHNGNTVSNDGRISGADTSTLTLNGLQTSDAGGYQLIITNAQGINQSSTANLTVVPTVSFNDNGAGWISQSPSASLNWQGGNVLQLTAASGNEDSSAFYSSPLYVGAFRAGFTYQVPGGPSGSADGATFCIQNDPRGAAAIGALGGNLGVGGTGKITPSVELEFNIYANNGIGGVGIAFGVNGTIAPVQSTSPLVINSGDSINVALSYQGGTLNALLTDSTAATSFSLSTNLNIPAIVQNNVAYVGFTGSDGGSVSQQLVSNFSFVSLLPISAGVSGANLLLSWPSDSGGYILQQSSVVGLSAVWTPVSGTPTWVNGTNQLSIPILATKQFYRLVLTNAP